MSYSLVYSILIETEVATIVSSLTQERTPAVCSVHVRSSDSQRALVHRFKCPVMRDVMVGSSI